MIPGITERVARREATSGAEPPASGPGRVEPPPSSGSDPPSSGPAANVYLHAGQIVATIEPCSITTIVGSCVTVCLFDPGRRAGGANHYVLPVAGSAAAASFRFGDVATLELVSRLMALGCRHGDLRAKIFGGASIIQASERIGAESLGMKNVRLAREILHERGIPVLADDVGGTRGRKVVFRTDNGDAWVRRV
jgi:chemotaxis protein CheD